MNITNFLEWLLSEIEFGINGFPRRFPAITFTVLFVFLYVYWRKVFPNILIRMSKMWLAMIFMAFPLDLGWWGLSCVWWRHYGWYMNMQPWINWGWQLTSLYMATIICIPMIKKHVLVLDKWTITLFIIHMSWLVCLMFLANSPVDTDWGISIYQNGFQIYNFIRIYLITHITTWMLIIAWIRPWRKLDDCSLVC